MHRLTDKLTQWPTLIRSWFCNSRVNRHEFFVRLRKRLGFGKFHLNPSNFIAWNQRWFKLDLKKSYTHRKGLIQSVNILYGKWKNVMHSIHSSKIVQIGWGHHVDFRVWKKSAITFVKGCTSWGKYHKSLKNSASVREIIISTMMASSNGNIFRVTGPLYEEFTGHGEFPSQRPVTRTFCVFFDLRLNKRLSKQSWGWWFQTPSCSLWRHSNVFPIFCDPRV